MKLLIKLQFLLLSLLSVNLASAGVKVKLITPGNNGKVAVGQKFQLIVTASGNNGDLKAPNPQGAEIVYRSAESMTVNGSQTSESTLTLLATTPGSYTFFATFGNQKSNVVKYTITDSSGSEPSSSATSTSKSQTQPAAGDPNQNQGNNPQFIGRGNENMFLRANVSKTIAYEQEAIVYTIKLYTTFNYIKFLGATAAPKFEGFVVEEGKIDNAQWDIENFNGKSYKAAVVAKYIIFPQKTGKLKILGNTYTVSADAMEYYNDPYFQRMVVKRPVQLNLNPNDLIVDVKALPSPRPADFSGGVGKFTITSSLPDQTYKTNQASQISYIVSGQGNLKYINLPDLSGVFPSQLEVFSPESDIEASIQGNTVSGNITFKYSFMPVETGDFAIPSVKLVYFNPETATYETSVTQGYNIKVTQGVHSEKSQTVRRFSSKLLPVGGLTKEDSPWILSFIYWIWYIIPTFIFLTVLGWYIIYRRNHADMEALRSKRAAKMAKKRLKKASLCLHRKDYDNFYDEMLYALWGYMSHKLKMPTSELTRQNIMQVLDSHNVSHPTASRAIELLDDCEYAKYSPSKDMDSMQSVYDKGARIIYSLESEFSRKAQNIKTDNDEEEFF